MRYRLGQHALDRMQERGITRQHIDAALASEIDRVRTPRHSWRIRGYGQSGRVLKVWIPFDDANFIKSVAWEGE